MFGAGLKIPCPFFHRKGSFQDYRILCPVQAQSLFHKLRGAFIQPVEIPHPAHIAGREAGCFRAAALQIFCRSHSRTFFRSVADQSAYLAVQLHLRQSCHHQCVQCHEHGAVIYGLPDIHPLFLSGAVRLILQQYKDKCGQPFPHLSLCCLFSNDLYHLLPQEDVLFIDSPVIMVMSEQPVVIICFPFDPFPKIGEGI